MTTPTPTASYQITGGNPIRGTLRCLGAKNFATKAMVAAILGDTPSNLTNVPPIGDVDITAEMLAAIGVTLDRKANELFIDPTSLKDGVVPEPDSGSNRIPILMLAPLLHRFSRVRVPVVGGCKIGKRKVDFHLKALQDFGATVRNSEGGYIAEAPNGLTGATIELPYPSVGATETCLFAAVRAKGCSIIRNAAIEPEILELITMLRAMGAIIFTTPSRELRIEGVERLSGTHMEILGDRIEAASWASLACASDGEITVEGIRPDNLGNFLSYFREVGGGFDLVGSDAIRFYRERPLSAIVIETDVWPGFSTDWQQPFAIVLTQAEGISIIHETVYENRFGYLRALESLGARVQLTNHCLGSSQCRYRHANHEHSAIITGPTRLTGGHEIAIPDLRAGLAYVIAAAVAEGTTTLTGLPYLERGYGDIVPRLRGLSLDINRVD